LNHFYWRNLQPFNLEKFNGHENEKIGKIASSKSNIQAFEKSLHWQARWQNPATGALQAMTDPVRAVCSEDDLRDSIVAVEMTKKRRRGPVSIGELLVPLLIRLGAMEAEKDKTNLSPTKTGEAHESRIDLTPSEARNSD
jgi:hypothetical protein